MIKTDNSWQSQIQYPRKLEYYWDQYKKKRRRYLEMLANWKVSTWKGSTALNT